MKKLATKIVMGAVFGWAISAVASDAPPLENGLVAQEAAKVNAAAAPSSVAVPTTEAVKSLPATSSAKSEKTEHNFEDLLVQGKYHFSDEAVTTVEEDKVLDSLLGIRTDFKDKIEQSAGRY